MSTKVMLVDDEGTVLKSLSRALNSVYDLTTAYSGEEAVTLIQKSPYAVVVTDMRMPGGDGLWLINRASELSPATQFIVLTGNCDQVSRESVEQSGKVSAFLTKPCSLDRIEAEINAALERHQQACRAAV